MTIPVAAVVEAGQEAFCWVKTRQGAEPRSIRLGDTNRRFTVVEAGLEEGEAVVLHPLAFEQARVLARQADDESKAQESPATKPLGAREAGAKPKSPGDKNKQKPKLQGVKPK